MRRVLIAGTASWLALTVSSPSIGQSPKDCGISRVNRSETGLTVSFVAERTIHITDRRGHSRVVMTVPWASRPLPGLYEPYAVRAATAVLGEHLSSHNSPEDSCSMTVTTRDGRIGIEAQASFNAIGTSGVSSNLFIPAERRSAEAHAMVPRYICWISRVEEADAGVNVFFSSPREVGIANPDGHAGRVVWTNPDSPVEASGDKGAMPVGAASADRGETLSISGAADDRCVMNVVSRAGKLGLETTDWFVAAE